MEESKKISFGFSKVTRKPIATSKPTLSKYNKIQLIDRLENQVIKTIDKPVVKVESPVVISTEQTNRFQNVATKVTLKVENEGKPDSELTEDEIAARELLREAQNITDGIEVSKPLMLPLVTETINDVQSTLEDYEDVPIKQFGMALLKKMGWQEGDVVGKNKNKPPPPQVDANVPRRFGQMGLGCDISAKLNKAPQTKEEKDKKLVLKAGSFGKIVSGKHKSNYCEVQGFDIDNPDSIIVKLSLTGKCVTIPDAYMDLVTKEEYNKSSKVINIAKYEEYKVKSETAIQRKRRSSCESDEEIPKQGGSKTSKREDFSQRRNYKDDLKDSKQRKNQRRSSDSEDDIIYIEKKSDTLSKNKEKRRDYEDDRRQRRKSSSYESDDDKNKQKSSKSSRHKEKKRDYERRKSSSLESEDEKFKSKVGKSSKHESKHKDRKRHDYLEEESRKYEKSRNKKKHKKHKKSYDSDENSKYKDSGRHSKYSDDRQRSDKKYTK